MYATRCRSMAARRPRGSNSSGGSDTHRLLAVLDAVDQPVDSPLGGELAALLEPLVAAGVAGDEHEGEVEAACVHDREQVVDRGRDGALFPAGDHRALATSPLGEI